LNTVAGLWGERMKEIKTEASVLTANGVIRLGLARRRMRQEEIDALMTMKRVNIVVEVDE